MSDANPISSEAAATAVKAVSKRYEGLAAVRTKAVRGKGAWYWAHLEPILIKDAETKTPKAVKLKCTLCEAAFSASNPSRTATEHLKKGTCPNFSSMSNQQLPPLASSPSPRKNHRKRTLQSHGDSLDVCPLNMVDPSRFITNDANFLPPQTVQAPPQLILSGGKDDYEPLARFESSVKKLKSPSGSPCPVLSNDQVKRAFDMLADWFYESGGMVSFTSLEHPKFRAFLSQVGLPAPSRMEFLCSRLDSKFEEARMESEARISDAAFFQLACDGWKNKDSGAENQSLVKFMVNLPNRTTVFQKAVHFDGGGGGGGAAAPSLYVEEVLWETVQVICGENAQRCVGIVSDKYKAKALRNLEIRHNWMVNLSCQVQGLFSLVKDFCRELPLFETVRCNCMKIASLINSTPQIRNSFHKFRLQGLDVVGFIRVPPPKCDVSKNSALFVAMMDDLLSCSRILHLIILDDSYKVGLIDGTVGDIAEVIQDVRFWNHVEAARSLMKMIMVMAEDIEVERPLIGQCLPLWEELRAKLKDWCTKYNIDEGPVEKIFERRFTKMYHPAWSAAFILDPLHLVRDAGGKYLPPFKCLTHEQEKDVDKLVTRLVSREEAPIALMELMKWRSEGLDPLYAQAVQVKQHDPVTGKLKIANPQGSRLVWETCLKDLKTLGKVAVRLLFLHATSCGIKHDWSFARWFSGQGQSSLGLERAQKLVFVAAHAKLKRQDCSSTQEKDGELFSSINAMS